jgi:hypothetical protein
MHNKHGKIHGRHRWALVLALACALLLLFGSTVQVVHVHSPEDVSHSGCSLCATAHVTVSPAVPVAVSLPVRTSTVAVFDTEPSFVHNLLDFSLYTRPPPVAIAFS